MIFRYLPFPVRLFLATMILVLAGFLGHCTYFLLDTVKLKDEWGEGVVETTGIDFPTWGENANKAVSFVEFRMNGQLIKVDLNRDQEWMMTWRAGMKIYCFYKVGRLSGKTKVISLKHARAEGG